MSRHLFLSLFLWQGAAKVARRRVRPFLNFPMKELRCAIYRLFEQGKRKSEISRLLQVPESTVRKVIKRFQETGSHDDRPGRGAKKTATTAANREKIKRRIQRNSSWSTRKLAKACGISRSSVGRIVKQDLLLRSYKLQKAHLLTEAMKETRLERCKPLKRRFAAGRHRSILFSDEKIFDIEQCYNRQNSRMWSAEPPSPDDRIVARSQKPKSVMVWAGVTHDGKTPLVFIPEGVKVNQDVYRAMLQSQVLPWTRDHFGNRHWTFQQDSAPSHKARKTQEWLGENFPDFITSDEWPPYSPDLNPLDFSIWSMLESKACAKPHNSIEGLKRSLKKAWNKISIKTVAKVVDNFPKRLQLCITSRGGHFEQA